MTDNDFIKPSERTPNLNYTVAMPIQCSDAWEFVNDFAKSHAVADDLNRELAEALVAACSHIRFEVPEAEWVLQRYERLYGGTE